MKDILLYCFALFVLTKCHVTARSKTDATTRLPLDNETEDREKESVKKQELTKVNVTKFQETGVYLDDVIFALKSQDWSVEEEPCLNQTLKLLRSLQNFTLWAVWGWDAISSQPLGLLNGNRYQLGNFDECMNTPWVRTSKEPRSQYCLAEIVLERNHSVKKKDSIRFEEYQSALDFIENRPNYTRPLNRLTWGICTPSSCQGRSVERLVSIMLARSHLGAGLDARVSVTEPCQKPEEPRRFDGPFYAFIFMSVTLFGIALLCTYLNNRRFPFSTEIPKNKWIAAFCLRENALDLLKVKREGIEVLYGIRFLTICLIVLDHQCGIFNSGPISNGLKVDSEILSTLGLFILHDDLFVDTFFLLSGFLTATTFAKYKRFPNVFAAILKRYVRLIVAFAVVIFYVCSVFPYSGSGPLWQRVISAETDRCRKNWWLSLLMLNNYIDSENICIVVTWYIPCDFHFFIVTTLLFCLYKRFPRLGMFLAGLLVIASIVVTGVINYVYKLPAVQLFTFEFVENPRGSEQFHLTYIKSHTRFAAYIVGFLSGYLFSYYSLTGNIQRIRKRWAIFATCSGLLVMLLVLIAGPMFLWRSHPLEDAVYAALNRPIWALGVATVVLSCSLGHVPLLKRFLSWYPWVPLSRLAYGLYLTHSLFVTRNIFVARNSIHIDHATVLSESAGVIFWGCIAALVIWLLAEAPANKLLLLCFLTKPKAEAVKKIENNSPNTVSHGTENSGYIHENLPSTVQFNSKM